jgi:hypothetical protein
MRRLALLGLVVVFGAGALVVLPGVRDPSGAAARQGAFESGGIGLSRAEWEAVHGPGDVGQNYVTYEGGRYYVQFVGDAVSFIELGWEDRGGVDAPDALAEVEALLPADAGFLETFLAPPTGGGLVGLTIDRYESEALPDRFPDAQPPPTGSILVVYQETPGQDRFEPSVTRASIAVGKELP